MYRLFIRNITVELIRIKLMNGITKDKENAERKERIKGIREGLRLTQEAMAEILDISVDAYGKIENGVNGVSSKVLKSYRDKLGVSADYILFGDHTSRDDAWDIIMNCSEDDKLYFMLHLVHYFQESKKMIYPLKDGTDTVQRILEMLRNE